MPITDFNTHIKELETQIQELNNQIQAVTKALEHNSLVFNQKKTEIPSKVENMEFETQQVLDYSPNSNFNLSVINFENIIGKLNQVFKLKK